MLADVARIMIHPRPTMRRVLDASRDRLWLPIVLLVALSAIAGDSDRHELNSLLAAARSHGIPAALVIAGIFVVGIAVSLILFYLFSYAAWGIGRVMEGTGTARDVRRAVAWGLTPAVWALLYRVPAVFLLPRSDSTVRFGQQVTVNPGRIGSGCAAALVFAALELVVVVWCAAVISNTVGEAHRFSSWRGLATVILTSLAPVIIIIAAVLAM